MVRFFALTVLALAADQIACEVAHGIGLHRVVRIFVLPPEQQHLPLQKMKTASYHHNNCEFSPLECHRNSRDADMENGDSITNRGAVHARMLLRTQVAQMLDLERADIFLKIE